MELGLSGKAQEALEPIPLQVTAGALPVWLEGVLYRNGPGTFDVELQDGRIFTVPHWFDGLTQLHAFHIGGGRVTYRSRHLYPAIEQHIKQHGTYGTFAGLGPDGLWRMLARRVLQLLRLAPPDSVRDPASGRTVQNVGVTIGHIGGSLFSRTDSNCLAPIDPETLAAGPSTSYTDMNPAFRGHMAAAHGQRDEDVRTHYNFTLELGPPPCAYRVFGIPDGEPGGHLLATVRADPAYVHSFAMSRRYLVLMVWPLLLDPLRMALHGAPARAFSWQPGRGTLFHVIDKQKGGPGHVATYRSDAFFAFHTINAWEAGGDLHIDVCAYDDGLAWHEAFQLPSLRSGSAHLPQATIRRYTLPGLEAAIAAGPADVHAASAEVVAGAGATPGGAHAYELPRISKARAMQPYRYVYAAAATRDTSPFFDAVAKVDVASGATQYWQLPDHFPGEPIFVGRPGGQREDDGVLLVVVLAAAERRSYLLVLDAGGLEEVARAQVPHDLKFGFHGNLVAPDGTSTELS